METYHGFDYNLEAFSKDYALKFILDHFAFMDAKCRPEPLQHEFLTDACQIVDLLEESYKLRRDYQISEASGFYAAKLSALLFGTILAAVCGLLLFYSSEVPVSLEAVLIIFISLAAICIALPVWLTIRAFRCTQNKAERLLISIHNIEMEIASMLTFIAQRNSISMVEERLDPDSHLKPHGKTLN